MEGLVEQGTYKRQVDQERGSMDGNCLLCENSPEIIRHAFFRCDFSHWLLFNALDVAGMA